MTNSTSSMKISSKSLLSPGHRDNQPSSGGTLSASLSRRLRTNRSLRGAQSPMFPSGKMRGGRQLDNAEPSSPKVTCIGQVRVKTRKKQANRHLHRTLSRNRGGGEVSFRGVDKNQRWVHLPLTICEALRAFGSEFSCLFPCRAPSCLSNEEREKMEESRERSSCGAVFARWLVAVDGGKREIELVVGGEEEEEERESGFRRHGVGEIELGLKEEQGRVSICVPPKNALLLMRCRSDPLRVNALANRLIECPVFTPEDEEDDEEREDGNLERKTEVKGIDSIFIGKFSKMEKSGFVEEKANPEEEIKDKFVTDMKEIEETEDLEAEKSEMKVQTFDDMSHKFEEIEADEANVDILSDLSTEFIEKEEKSEVEKTQDIEILETEGFANEKTEDLAVCETVESSIGKAEELAISETEKEELEISKAEEWLVRQDGELEIFETEGSEFREPEQRRNSRFSCSSVLSLHLEIAERDLEIETVDPQSEETEEEEEEVREPEIERARETVLPDCLLLMRCEPKLSMEVSKETWVCSTDFIRRLPKRPTKSSKISKLDGPKKRSTVESSYAPPRSSCSYPAPPPTSMAALIEQRLMNAAAYEPFVLTRCKSEPMRTAAAKLMPEPCFWEGWEARAAPLC